MDTLTTVTHPQLFEPSLVQQLFSNIDISEKTRKDYLYRIGRFQGFISQTGTFDRNSLLEFKRHLSSDSSITVTTKNKYLIVGRVFCQQLYRLGVLKVDISTGVKSFRLNSGFKTNGFTDEEVTRIVTRLNQLTDIRLKTILSLKMFSGLRDIEITRLTVEGVNLTDGVLQIHGKGRDGVEPLPIVPQVVEVLKTYLEITGKRSGFLFTSESKRNKGSGLTTKTVWLIVRTFLDGLEIYRNPHQCRSFFTTSLVKKMENLFDVITFTRHRNIQTLQNYVNQIGKGRILPKFHDAFSDYPLG